MVALALVVLMGGWPAAKATASVLFSDDFNRANNTTIGTGWTEMNNQNWSILSQTVVMQVYEPANAPSILEYTGLTMPGQYSIASDVSLDASGYLNGLAFNIQNVTNYYALRFMANGDTTGFLQLLKYVDGTPSVLASTASFAGISPLVWYRATVFSSSPGSFTYEISNGSTTLLAGSATDLGTPFTGGYGGLYTGSIGGNFDNFEINVIPEPSMLSLIILGAALFRRKLKGIA